MRRASRLALLAGLALAAPFRVQAPAHGAAVAPRDAVDSTRGRPVEPTALATALAAVTKPLPTGIGAGGVLSPDSDLLMGVR
jgi:hypothetical protein